MMVMQPGTLLSAFSLRPQIFEISVEGTSLENASWDIREAMHGSLFPREEELKTEQATIPVDI